MLSEFLAAVSKVMADYFDLFPRTRRSFWLPQIKASRSATVDYRQNAYVPFFPAK